MTPEEHLLARKKKARALREKVARLRVCLVCGMCTEYPNGFCGPCWNRNYDVASGQALNPDGLGASSS